MRQSTIELYQRVALTQIFQSTTCVKAMSRLWLSICQAPSLVVVRLVMPLRCSTLLERPLP